jgi:uncharacterized protein (TIGR03435 family)
MQLRICAMVTAGLTVFVCREAFGQPASPRPAFEAASIRPPGPREGIDMNTFPSGRLEATNVTLKQLIEAAYGFKPYLVLGGPAWLGADRFDISAKADEEAAQDKSRAIALGRDAPLRMMLMLQTLLEDRFKVKVHRDTKQDTVYDLVVAKNGSKLQKSTGGDDQRPFVGLGRDCPCDFNKPATAMYMKGQRATVGLFAERLEGTLGHPVRDKTGLAGDFDFVVHYSGDDSQPDSGPSIFTAVQEQLGLKLEAAKGPVEILVVDHAEKPSDN